MSRIALESPGALGAAVGAALAAGGHQVVCAAGGRGAATVQRAGRFASAPTLAAALDGAAVLLSVVPPAAAIAVARAAAASGRLTGRLYLDMNAVGPAAAAEIALVVAAAGGSPVKASVFGPADAFGPANLVVLSGDAVAAAAALLAPHVAILPAGAAFADAAALKMAVSLVTKGLPALFLESLAGAAAGGQAPVLLALLDRLYPGVMAFLRRTLPSYRVHGGRRADELDQVAGWLQAAGRPGAMALAGAAVLRLPTAGAMPFCARDAGPDLPVFAPVSG